MKRITTLLLIFTSLMFSKNRAAAQTFTFPPFETDPACFDGSSYSLNVVLDIRGIQVTNVFTDDGVNGSFAFEVLFEYLDVFNGTIGNGATSFYTYDVTLYSSNPNLVANQVTNNLQVPLSNASGDNLSLNNNDTYNGSASAMGLTANTTYVSQDTIDMFGFDSAYINVGAPCLNASAGAHGLPTAPLAIMLTDFYTSQNNGDLVLHWITAQETNNKGFHLQKSADGKKWNELAQINSQAQNGNSASPLKYEYTDHNPFAGNNFYRLIETSTDGRSTYSKVVKAYFKPGNTAGTLTGYPSPASNKLYVKYNGITNDQPVLLMDGMGHILTQIKTSTPEMSIDIAHLPNGNYILRSGTNNIKVAVLH